MNLNNENSENISHPSTVSRYFEKKVPEEDTPIDVDAEAQNNYADIEKLYEGFFEENFLATAKVNNYNIYSFNVISVFLP